MNELQRHKLTFKVLSPIIKVFLKLKFNYIYDDLSKIEGPYLLLANHNLELDPALVGVAARKQLYFVASEHILRKGFGTWFLMTFFKPIIHMKGRQGMNTVKQMLKMLREGHSVCIFPEGNRSFNGRTGEILPSIGKVAGRCGAKLVTYRIEGGYLTQPRWSITLRRGKLRGRLIKEYTVEELKSMTNEQIYTAICSDLYEDAYETQKREHIAFRGKNLARGLESTIFTCPACEEIGTLHSKKSRFYCDCGFDAVYNVYGDLTDRKGKKYTITELDDAQRKLLRKRMEDGIERKRDDNDLTCNGSEEKAYFSDNVTFYEIDGNHTLVRSYEGLFTAYEKGFELCGRQILYENVQGMAIYSRNCIILHVRGMEGHIELKSSDIGFSALKYLYLYQAKEKVS